MIIPRIVDAKAFAALHKNSAVLQIIRLVTLLCVFVLFDFGYRHLTKLGEYYLQEPILLLAFFRKQGWLGLAVMVVSVVGALRYGRFWIGWSELDHGYAIRNFIVLLSCVLGIGFTLQGYNYYFDQGYYLDRALLLSFVVLIFWRPVFIYPLLLFLFLLIWQRNAPLGGYIWGTIHHATQALLMFGAWLVLCAFKRDQKSTDFVFLVCCLTASVYWVPGLLKFNIDWLAHDQIRYMPLAAYSHGWLTFLSPQQLVSYAEMVMPAEQLLHIMVLGFELGALVSLWRRRLFMGLLMIATVFHFSVFAAYGYMLWAWMTIDIGLLLLIFRLGPNTPLFTRPQFVISILLILSSGYWLNPPKLAWYNTPLNYTYHYQATGYSGADYNLSPRFFAPYGDIMTMARFHYLSPGARLVGPYGITSNPELADKLRMVESAEDIFLLEEQAGEISYSESKAEKFYAFIRDYLSHLNNAERPGGNWFGFNCCRTPPQFWSLTPVHAYTGQEPVKKVTVSEITTFYDKIELKEIRRLKLKTIDIP